MQETWVQSLILEDPLKREMATHSSILAWKTIWTEEPGGLQSMGLQSQTRLSEHIHRRTHYIRILTCFGCAGSLLLIRLFSSCSEWGLLFVTVPGLLTAVASPVAEHGL